MVLRFSVVVALALTGLPKASSSWTVKGPTLAVVPTGWLPVGTVVKLNWLAFPAVMVKPFVVSPVTAWPLTVAPATVMVGVPANVSE